MRSKNNAHNYYLTRWQSKSQSGFTLVELLVSLVLMGLIASLLYVAFTVGIAQWSRTEMRFSGMETALAGRQAVRRLLGAAYPLYENDSEVAFTGSAERLTFLAPLPASLGSGELAEWSISAVGPLDSRYLTLDMSNLGSFLPVKTRILENKITSVEFAYFGTIANQNESSWHSSWIGETHLPSLVRIRVKDTESKTSQQIDWVVRLFIDVDVGCVYDFVSRACHGRS